MDLPHPVWSDRIRNDPIVVLDLKNVRVADVAVEIALLSSLQAEL